MENFATYKLDQTGQQTQAILDQVSTNTADIAQLRALYEALTQSEPVIIQPSDTWPVADPQENVIYRVIDRVNTPPQSYSDYMWNGTAMVLMATYNNPIDNEPTPGSNNLVKSGGVAASIVFDISAYHATGSTLATYSNLAAALGTDGANVPASVRKGGMSVKFVKSSDNKYVQFRLMSQTFTTDVAKWQGVDEKPTGGSHNLVESWGVKSELIKLSGGTLDLPITELSGKYYGYYGELQDWGNGRYAEVSLEEYAGGTLTITMADRVSNSGANTGIYKDGAFVNHVQESDYTNPVSWVIPENSTLKLSHHKNSTVVISIFMEDKINPIIKKLNDIEPEVETLDIEINGNHASVIVENPTFYDGYNYYATGVKVEDSGAKYANPIDISQFAGNSIKVTLKSHNQAERYTVVMNTSGVAESYCKEYDFASDGDNYSHTFQLTDNAKYLLISMRNTNELVSIIGEHYVSGLTSEVSTINEGIVGSELITEENTVYKAVMNYETLQPLTGFNGGKYAIIDVSAGDKYRISCYSWYADTYIGAFVYNSSSNAKQALLASIDTIYQNVLIKIPDGYNKLVINTAQYGNDIMSCRKTNEVTNFVKTVQSIIDENVVLSTALQKRSLINNSIISQRNVPIVTFIYDDDDIVNNPKMMAWLDARGLKASFATIGNINPYNTKWSEYVAFLNTAIKNGHGTLGHGLVNGLTPPVSGVGIGDMNDEETHRAIRGNCKALDDFGFAHRGLVYFNRMTYNPHTRQIVSQYYDWALVNDGDGLNTYQRSNWILNRNNTDGADVLISGKTKVDQALGKPIWLIFGGHAELTGSGNPNCSTEADFLEFLDYVADKVNNGQMIALNADDAFDVYAARKNGNNVISALGTEDLYNPIQGSLRYDNGLKYCLNEGVKALYTLELSGVPTNGSFDLVLGGVESGSEPTTYQTITIETTTEDSIDDIYEKIISSIYHAYTVRKNNDIIYMYRDLPDVTFTPYLNNNTSGLVAEFTTIHAGELPTFVDAN